MNHRIRGAVLALCTLAIPGSTGAVSVEYDLRELADESSFLGHVRILTARVVGLANGDPRMRCSIVYTAETVESFKGSQRLVEFHYSIPLLPGGEYILNLREASRLHPNERSGRAYSAECQPRLPTLSAGPFVFNISSPFDLVQYAEQPDTSCGSEPHLQDLTFSIVHFTPHGPLGCTAAIPFQFVAWAQYREHLKRVIQDPIPPR